MHIKINEKDGLFGLWATEQDGPNEVPVYSARKRTAEQIQRLIGTILGEQAAPAAAPEPRAPRMSAPEIASIPELRKVAQSQALYAMLCALDGWIAGAQENHEALGHRTESTGSECWRNFAPGDIRNMVNDAARELGISEFPLTKTAKEDAK